MKVKSKDLPQWKKDTMVAQGFICPVCRESMRGLPLSKVAADHDHSTGYLRGVLHMSCNRAEGVILGAATRWARRSTPMQRIQCLRDLADYWESHGETPSGLVYPTHKTPEQQVALKKKRALSAAKKRRATK